MKWTHRMMELAQLVASWSKDPRTKVGAVLVDSAHGAPLVIGLGYNGFPRGVNDDPERYEDRELKYKLIVHAELNAIHNCKHDTRGAALYTTMFPCSSCAKSIIQAGIAAVISPPPLQDSKWLEEARVARQMFDEASVDVIGWSL
jgi:dCMP deaminase